MEQLKGGTDRNRLMMALGLIVSMVFLSNSPVQAQSLTPAQVFEKVKDAVVVVKTLDAKGKQKGQGSGVIISPGRIATNCHVVEGGVSYRVGQGKQLVSATLYAEDKKTDICLLDAKDVRGTPAQLGKAGSLKVGEPVYAVGAPYGLELSLSDGIVAQLRGGPPPMIQMTAAISPGSSGGGLFDGQGRLVGLTTLYLKGGQSLNFAMPVEWISEIKPGRKAIAKGRSQVEWAMGVIALENAKDWQGMLDWCGQWTKSDPMDAFAWFTLGVAYQYLNRHHDAIDAYRQAIRINPEHAESWYNLGDAYVNLNRHHDVIDAYRQAIRINPEHAFAWNNLGNAYVNLNRHHDAIDAFRQAIRINPEDSSAWANLGATYGKLNRYDAAIDACRQAIRINPEHAASWTNLGTAYLNLKRDHDAIDAYRQAIRINPEHALAWYNLGLAYDLIGNRTAALDAVRKLRRLDPTRADRLFNLIVPR